GCQEFGVLGTSYGGWIGALLTMVERDFRFVALMAPIVNVEHAIWESPAARFMRRELRRANIEPSLIARHFHLSSPMHNQPLCDANRVVFVAGEFDLIARPEDVEKIHGKWRGSELLRLSLRRPNIAPALSRRPQVRGSIRSPSRVVLHSPLAQGESDWTDKLAERI